MRSRARNSANVATAGRTWPPVPPPAMTSRSERSDVMSKSCNPGQIQPASIVTAMGNRIGAGAAVIVMTIGGAVIALDLASKWVARRELRYGEDRWLLDGIIGLELV